MILTCLLIILLLILSVYHTLANISVYQNSFYSKTLYNISTFEPLMKIRENGDEAKACHLN